MLRGQVAIQKVILCCELASNPRRSRQANESAELLNYRFASIHYFIHFIQMLLQVFADCRQIVVFWLAAISKCHFDARIGMLNASSKEQPAHSIPALADDCNFVNWTFVQVYEWKRLKSSIYSSCFRMCCLPCICWHWNQRRMENTTHERFRKTLRANEKIGKTIETMRKKRQENCKRI